MVRSLKAAIAFSAAFSILNPQAAEAQLHPIVPVKESRPQTNQLRDVRAEVLEMIEKGEVPGVAIAVARDGEILWAEGLGYADVENNRPMTVDTVMPIASISKSIATSLLMVLVSDGTLSLDDEVAPYLEPLTLHDLGHVGGRPPTIRDVISMTAGIGHGWFGVDDYDALPPREELFKWYGQAVFPTGSYAHYSNWSAGLAGIIVEQVTGKPLEKFARERLFDPLAMKHSFTRLPEDSIKDVAVLYNSRMQPLLVEETGYSVPEGGVGTFSTAADLLRFGMYHAGSIDPDRLILSDDALRAMHDAPTLGPSYAMGFHRLGGPLISNGNTNRVATELEVFPEEKLVITVLMNRASWDMLPGQIAAKIAEAVRGKPTISTMTAEVYMTEWEPAYDGDKAPLDGRWSGYVVDPSKQQNIPVELKFNGADASFRFGEASTQLENIRLNSRGHFMASATIDDFVLFREGEDPVAGLTFELLRSEEDKLVGYIRMDRSEETYYYALPVAACFARDPI